MKSSVTIGCWSSSRTQRRIDARSRARNSSTPNGSRSRRRRPRRVTPPRSARRPWPTPRSWAARCGPQIAQHRGRRSGSEATPTSTDVERPAAQHVCRRRARTAQFDAVILRVGGCADQRSALRTRRGMTTSASRHDARLKCEDHRCSAARRVVDRDLAADRLDESASDREPEPDAVGRPPCRRRAVGTARNTFARSVRDARALVDHAQVDSRLAGDPRLRSGRPASGGDHASALSTTFATARSKKPGIGIDEGEIVGRRR